MDVYLPQEWPADVSPPGSDDFEATAVAWLLDVLPADFRRCPVVRRHPAALASIARHPADACVEGARQGYRTARLELSMRRTPLTASSPRTRRKGSGCAPSPAALSW
jgi:hypothetical protein